jgi:hypothetical protein
MKKKMYIYVQMNFFSNSDLEPFWLEPNTAILPQGPKPPPLPPPTSAVTTTTTATTVNHTTSSSTVSHSSTIPTSKVFVMITISVDAETMRMQLPHCPFLLNQTSSVPLRHTLSRPKNQQQFGFMPLPPSKSGDYSCMKKCLLWRKPSPISMQQAYEMDIGNLVCTCDKICFQCVLLCHHVSHTMSLSFKKRKTKTYC